MSRIAALFLAVVELAAHSAAASAQNPLGNYTEGVEIRFARTQPVVSYTLRVDAGDLSGLDVELRLRNARDTFRLAMVAHPEYDDRYWRYVEALRVETPHGAATVTREDSALWRVVAAGGEALVRYRIHLPPAESPRAAWRPFLAATGGLVGGPHSLLYVVGATLAPSHVTLELPPGWQIATGLEPTLDPHTFFAPSVGVLVDSPLLVGRLRSWRFAVDGVPHRVVYWQLPDAAPFDTAELVGGIERLTRQAVALFGRAPYRDYSFLLQDGAYGALEHRSSVTLGAPSAELARDPSALLGEIAHEYFHTWNLMRIHPAEYGDVSYRPPRRARGLWWSEGLTMLYADLLLRRAGLPVFDSTRVAHLEALIGRYLASPGNSRFSPESVSVVAYGVAPGSLGDYSASTHLQGELLGAMLDLIVRDATSGARSIDDVMRAMLERFSGERGFGGRDVEQTVAGVCGCTVRPFFEAHVRGRRPIDFDRYLRPIGMRARVSWTQALDRDGRPAADLRVSAWQPPGENALSLVISNPASVWGRAGLHSGDRLVTLNGAAVPSWEEFRGLRSRLKAGDTVTVEVRRPTGPWRTSVVVAGYERPVVRLEEIPQATERQRRLRAPWAAGSPR
jgi:predicted metalloprotease with PDZ domain